MRPAVVLILLFLSEAVAADVGSLKVLAEFTHADIDGELQTNDLLIGLGTEWFVSQEFGLGASMGVADYEKGGGLSIKADAYAKLTAPLDLPLSPYVTGGVGVAGISPDKCRVTYETVAGELRETEKCEDGGVLSVGGFYRLGVSAELGGEVFGELYLQRYHGTEEVEVDSIGLSVGTRF